MFEKEADKAETKMIVESNGVYSKFKNYKEGFKDGAEFGYNKAKAEDEYITPTFIEYVQKLEQENTELKEYNKYLKRKRQGGIQKQYNKVSIIKQQKEQLTKAKEIIKTLADDLSMYSGNYQKELLEAEQFLKESE